MTTIPNRSRSVARRVAIVTGAASGMGRATAMLLAKEGARVAVTDLDTAGCQTVAAACGDGARAYALDVSDGDAIAQVVAQVAADFGGIDILVNNAGISSFCALEDDAYEETWHRALAVMLTAQQRMVRAALPHLRKSDAARIVNVASTEGLGATPGDTPTPTATAGSTPPVYPPSTWSTFWRPCVGRRTWRASKRSSRVARQSWRLVSAGPTTCATGQRTRTV